MHLHYCCSRVIELQYLLKAVPFARHLACSPLAHASAMTKASARKAEFLLFPDNGKLCTFDFPRPCHKPETVSGKIQSLVSSRYAKFLYSS